MKPTVLTAAGLAAALLTAAPAVHAQTSPELVDLPTYLAYVASHPTRPFSIGVPGAGASVFGAIVSPALGGGTGISGLVEKNQLRAVGVAQLKRDPRKIRSIEEVRAVAAASYGNEFSGVAGAENGALFGVVYQAKAGTVGARLDPNDSPGTTRLFAAAEPVGTYSTTYLTPEELAQGNYDNLNSDTQFNGGDQELVIENSATHTVTDNSDEPVTDVEEVNTRTRRIAYTDHKNDIGAEAHWNEETSARLIERRTDDGALRSRTTIDQFENDKGASVHVKDVFRARLSDQEQGLSRLHYRPNGEVEYDNDNIIDYQNRSVEVGVANDAVSAEYQQYKNFRQFRHEVARDESWGHLNVSVAGTPVVDATHTPHDPLSEDEPLAYQLNAPAPFSGELDLASLGEGEVPNLVAPTTIQNGQHGLGYVVGNDQAGVGYSYGREFLAQAFVFPDDEWVGVIAGQVKFGWALATLDMADIRADLLTSPGLDVSADVFNAGGAGLVIVDVNTPAGGGTLPIGEGAPASPTSLRNAVLGFIPTP